MSISEHIYNGELPNVLTTLYTVSAPIVRLSIRYIKLVNRDPNNYLRWWLYLVPGGAVADNSNILIPGTDQYRAKPGKGLYENSWSVLHPGYTIQAYGDGPGTIFIDGAKEK